MAASERTPRLLALLAALAAAPAYAERYVIDPRHTRPVFAVSHLGFSSQHGRFNEVRGSIEIDRERGTASIDVTIEAASIDMGEADWDKHMRSADFFDVEAHPTVIFRAEQLDFDGPRPVAAHGRLSLLGTVQPLTLKIERFRCGREISTRREKCGADVSATLRRSDFGMGKFVPFVGDEVRLMIPVEAYLETTPAE